MSKIFIRLLLTLFVFLGACILVVGSMLLAIPLIAVACGAGMIVETVFISLASYAGISIDKGNGSHDTVLDGVIMLFSPLIFPFYISYTFLVKGELDT